MKDNPVVVGIAQGAVVHAPEQLITYALGSCVGVCLYDRTTHTAGLAHIMLPCWSDSLEHSNPYKFADSGCGLLLRRMAEAGCAKERLTAKLAGGASMFYTSDEIQTIGARNVRAVKEALRNYRIPVISEDTGKDYGRTIVFDAETGSLIVKSFKAGTITI